MQPLNDTLIDDVLNLIFDNIKNSKEYINIRLSCKRWSILHKKYAVNKINHELNIEFESLKTLCEKDQLWLPYVGSYNYYLDLMIQINSIVKSDELFKINCYEEKFSNIKKITSTLKHFQTSKKRFQRPIIINNNKYSLNQRECANTRMLNFIILIKAEEKVVKDLSNCPTCLRLCKHYKVNLGHNIIESEVIVSANMPFYEYNILSHGEKQWIENNSCYKLIRNIDKIAYIQKYVYAARELGVKYFKYNMETASVIFYE